MRSIEEECPERPMILFGERSLPRCVRELTAHYHAERNHQGTGNELIDGGALQAAGPIECHERLGGLLEYDQHAALVARRRQLRWGTLSSP